MKRVSCVPAGHPLLAGGPILCDIILFVLRKGQPAEIFPPTAPSVCSRKTYCSLYAEPSCSRMQPSRTVLSTPPAWHQAGDFGG